MPRIARLLTCAAVLLTASAAVAQKKQPIRIPTQAPKSMGMDADKLAKIPKAMQGFVDAGQISGAVTLVAGSHGIVHEEAVGLANIANKTPTKTDSIFAIASMTKPITATAVMILVDEGKVKLSDPVSKYIPQFKTLALKNGDAPLRQITVFDCLTHTAGLQGSQQNQGSLKETAEAIAERPLAFQPGEKWQYSPGLTVCGRIVEVASEQPFEEFLQERIFDPLEMRDTTFNPTPEQRKRVVTLYRPGKQKGTLQAATHWINDTSSHRSPNPSGGLFSTAADMAQFYNMIRNGGSRQDRRIVSPESVRKMTTVQTGDLTTGFTPGNGWGLGWCVVREPQGATASLSPGTYGHGGAFGTQGWVDPQRRMIYVLMIQRTAFGNSDASDIRGTLHKLAVESLVK